MLRHALASAMAANKEPASIIAAQLRHADGGALAQRIYIHHYRRPSPGGGADRGAHSAQPRRLSVGRSEIGAKPDPQPRLTRYAAPTFAHVRRLWQGQDRTCVGNAGDFTDRSPRPDGRGPIAATPATATSTRVPTWSPRLDGRGPIAADSA
jgi:hypothetical protein